MSGFSGAKSSIDFEDKIFIKCDDEVSGTLEYQHLIQKEIYQLLTGKLRTPRVLDIQIKENFSSLTMEYVEGQTLHELLESGDHKSASLVLNFLWSDWSGIDWKDKFAHANFVSQISDLDYEKKLNTIYESANCLGIHQNKIFETLWNGIGLINLPKSKLRFCHGDMNFENVIYSKGLVYLYDFIKSPFPCLEQDVSKIIQDGIGGWCFRKTATGDSLEPYMITRDLVLKLFQRQDIDIDLTKKLSYLSCLRIIPYIKNNADCLAWLNVANRINTFFEKQL
jgi:serine/threonine protein kinase